MFLSMINVMWNVSCGTKKMQKKTPEGWNQIKSLPNMSSAPGAQIFFHSYGSFKSERTKKGNLYCFHLLHNDLQSCLYVLGHWMQWMIHVIEQTIRAFCAHCRLKITIIIVIHLPKRIIYWWRNHFQRC